MERSTQEMFRLIEEMARLAPEVAENGVGRRVTLQLGVCNLHSIGSVARNEQAYKAMMVMAKGLADHLWSTAGDKNRGLELVGGLLLIGPSILNGGRLPQMEKCEALVST